MADLICYGYFIAAGIWVLYALVSDCDREQEQPKLYWEQPDHVLRRLERRRKRRERRDD